MSAAAAQYIDYAEMADDAGRFGSMQVNVAQGSLGPIAGTTQNLFPDISKQTGHGGNRRFCHTTGHQRAIWQWSSSANGGYFNEGRNRMECIGEELYCFIEERAQFGQIIAITAGCEQMMNHPQVMNLIIEPVVNLKTRSLSATKPPLPTNGGRHSKRKRTSTMPRRHVAT